MLRERDKLVLDLEQQVLGVVVELGGREQVEAAHAFAQVGEGIADAVHRDMITLTDALDDVSLD